MCFYFTHPSSITYLLIHLENPPLPTMKKRKMSMHATPWVCSVKETDLYMICRLEKSHFKNQLSHLAGSPLVVVFIHLNASFQQHTYSMQRRMEFYLVSPHLDNFFEFLPYKLTEWLFAKSKHSSFLATQ